MNFFSPKIKSLFPIYTLFLASSMLFHLYFILSGSYFVENCCDSLKQVSYFYVFLERFFNEGFQMWSWNYGIGGDIYGQFVYYYTTSPFYWFTFLVTSINDLQDIFEIRLWISISKLLLTLIFMFHFLRYFNRSIMSAILGSLIYGGSTYFTFHSLRYDFLVDGMVLLPLLLLGFERYSREDKKGLFVFSVFLTICTNFYLAFMNSLFLGMFVIFSYFYNGRKFALKDFSLYSIRFTIFYLIGLLLASFSFLPSVFNFTKVDRFFYETNLPLFFNPDFYLKLPYELLFTTIRYPFVASIPIISLFLLLTTILLRKHVSVFIFTLFIFLLTLLPFTYSMFNGFSSVQYRWLYLLVFIVAFSISFVIDNIYSVKRYEWLVVGIIGMTIMFISVLYKNELFGVPATTNDNVILLLTAGTILLLFFNSMISKKVFPILLIGLTLFNLSYTNYTLFNSFLGDSETFADKQQLIVNSSNYGLDSEHELFLDLRTKDHSFYRTVWNNQQEINAPLLYNFNGMSAYNSMLDGNVHRFFKTDLNTLQQNAPSMFKNADNRIFIETLLNTKYYISDENSSYIPYGYIPYKNYGNLKVSENQNKLPIGFALTSYLTEEQFDSLSFAQRDETLLSTIVLEESNVSFSQFDLNKLEAHTTVVPLDQIKLENASIDGNVLKAQQFNGLSIPLQLPPNDGEVKIEVSLKKITGDAYTMTANGKTFTYSGDKSVYAYPQETIVFNLMNKVTDPEVRIELSPGEYQLKEVKVHYNSYERFQHLFDERNKESLQNVEVQHDLIKGDIKVKEKSILFMSVPYSPGWHVRVDGQTVEPFRVHGAFIGIPVEEGSHDIEMSFRSPYLLEGFSLSLLTLFGLTLWFIRQKKYKRNDEL